MTSNPRAILIDTDIGDDVDDAFALAFAARHPGLRLCGVTTVAGPVVERAALARLLLSAAGPVEVPIVPGSSATISGRPGSTRFSHRPLLEYENNRLRTEKVWPTHQCSILYSQMATDLILDHSRRYAPLTLIALGPLTNIAAALRRDPTLVQRVQLVAMAGKLGVPYPDWNVRCDPAAARVVLDSGMPTTLVGMHVTMRCKLRPAQVRRLFERAEPLARMLARCVIAWRSWKRRMPIPHDALAIAVAAEPAIVSLEARRVRVLPGGFSLASRRAGSDVLVCRRVDVERFHALFDELLLGGRVVGEPGWSWDRLLHYLA